MTVAWPVLNFVKSCVRVTSALAYGVAVYFVQLPMLGRTRRTSSGLCSQQHARFLTLFWPRLQIIVSNVLRDRVREIVNELLDGMPNPPTKSLVSLECT